MGVEVSEPTGRHLRMMSRVATLTEGRVSAAYVCAVLRAGMDVREAHVCVGASADGRRVIAGGRSVGATCTWTDHSPGRRWFTTDDVGVQVATFPIVGAPAHGVVLHLAARHELDADDMATAAIMAALLRPYVGSTWTDHEDALVLAHQDPLTGLANRRVFDDRLAGFFDAGNADATVTLMLFDVDGLKTVNDTLGHASGDRLLREIAAMIAGAASALDRDALAARLGGDEFAIIAYDLDEIAMDKTVLALTTAVAQLPDGTGLSCGVASSPGTAPGASSSELAARGLLRLADADAYAHKPERRRVADPDRSSRPRRPDDSELADLPAQIQRRHASLATSAVVERLSVAAQLVAERFNASTWTLSEREGESVIARACGSVERRPMQWDEPESTPVDLDPHPYALADFPATAQAVEGGAFHANLREGDPAERFALAADGYRSILAAGGVDSHGRTWLVEIFGDYLTDDMTSSEPLLAEIVAKALIV